MNAPIKCDHEGCEKDSIGYADRQLQGPFYCAEHEKWAIDLATKYWYDLDVLLEEEDRKEKINELA